MGLDLYCGNPECKWHSEKKGGRFSHVLSGPDKGAYCEDCMKLRWAGNPGRNLWDFTTSNITGSPVHINSLGQLRQMEKQYGVSSVTANSDSKNWARS